MDESEVIVVYLSVFSDGRGDEEQHIDHCLDSQQDFDTVSISSERNDFTQSHSVSDRNAHKQTSISVEHREVAETISKSCRKRNDTFAAAKTRELAGSESMTCTCTCDTKTKKKKSQDRRLGTPYMEGMHFPYLACFHHSSCNCTACYPSSPDCAC